MSGKNSPSRIGIVFAQEMEANGLRSAFNDSMLAERSKESADTYQVGPLEIVIKTSGGGGAQCAAAVDQIIQSGVDRVLIAGFAASLVSNGQAGDVLVAESIRTTDDSAPVLKCTRSLTSAAPPDGTLGRSIGHGTLLTTDEHITSTAEKTWLAEKTGAAAVDTFSYASAQVCSQAKVPFACVKAISETLDQEMPQSTGGLAAAAQKLVSSSARKLSSQLREQERAASTALGDVLGIMVLRIG